MSWVRNLFIDNSRIYAMTLETLWHNDEVYAGMFSKLLEEKGLKNCRVIDVPCGIGRVSVPLAKLGYAVTGLDISAPLIQIAETKSKQLEVRDHASFRVGDMKEVDSVFPEQTFDAALNFFTSLGYSTDSEDKIFFKSLRRVMGSDRLFVIGGLANRDYLVSHFVPNLYEWNDKLLVLHRNELDISNSTLRSTQSYYLREGDSLRLMVESPFNQRLYSPHELTNMLEESSWHVEGLYDSLSTRRTPSTESPNITLLARAV